MIDRSPFAPDADDDPGPARARRLAARAEALRALMHDLKATQTSMLSLLELRRLRAAAVDEARLAEAIDTGARRALRLVRDLECFAFAATARKNSPVSSASNPAIVTGGRSEWKWQ